MMMTTRWSVLLVLWICTASCNQIAPQNPFGAVQPDYQMGEATARLVLEELTVDNQTDDFFTDFEEEVYVLVAAQKSDGSKPKAYRLPEDRIGPQGYRCASGGGQYWDVKRKYENFLNDSIGTKNAPPCVKEIDIWRGVVPPGGRVSIAVVIGEEDDHGLYEQLIMVPLKIVDKIIGVPIVSAIPDQLLGWLPKNKDDTIGIFYATFDCQQGAREIHECGYVDDKDKHGATIRGDGSALPPLAGLVAGTQADELPYPCRSEASAEDKLNNRTCSVDSSGDNPIIDCWLRNFGAAYHVRLRWEAAAQACSNHAKPALAASRL